MEGNIIFAYLLFFLCTFFSFLASLWEIKSPEPSKSHWLMEFSEPFFVLEDISPMILERDLSFLFFGEGIFVYALD